MPIPDLKTGDPLTLAYLNGVADAIRAGQVAVDTSSGMEAQIGPWGAAIAHRKATEGWYRVVSAVVGTPGSYNLHRVLDAAGGTWVDAPGTPVAREANGNTSVPITTGPPTYVYAWRGRKGFIFQYGSCATSGSGGPTGTGTGTGTGGDGGTGSGPPDETPYD